jgi:thiol-disulfide isomerase/thioredoxin
MQGRLISFLRALGVCGLFGISISPGTASSLQAQEPKESPPAHEGKPSASKQHTPEEDLQRAIDNSGNDRAALARNLEAYLKKYPDTRRKSDIYRALVEANLQLRDTTAAANYAERIVALSPDDMSMNLLAIQLIDRAGDQEGMKRAISYATRVLDHIQRQTLAEKSPRVSQQEWEDERRQLQTTVLLLRGRLYDRQSDHKDAIHDLEASYALAPNSAAAEKLGEIAELQKDLNRAIAQYARAFVLAESAAGSDGRQAIRRKLGNVWRLAHGSEDGLGDYILRAYDETALAARTPPPKRNPDAREPYDFTLRRIPEGTPLAFSRARGKVVVLNFWATWCGPCRALEPLFERVSSEFRADAEVIFLSANCDEDESLVPPYLAEEKIQTTTVFADGLNKLLGVNSYPTVIVLDRSGKISYRSEGFGEEDFEKILTAAIQNALAAQHQAK